MKTAIIALILSPLIVSCSMVDFEPTLSAQRLVCPDVVEYSCEVQKALADEIRGKEVTTAVIADYHVMRNQSRRCLGKSVPPLNKCAD